MGGCNNAGEDARIIGKRLLTLLLAPVQWTIAWLWVASPLSTKELLSRDICFSRDRALRKRGELPAADTSSSASVGNPPPPPPPPPNPRCSTRTTPPPARTGPGRVIQVEAVSRKTQTCAAPESKLWGRWGAMGSADGALLWRRLMRDADAAGR